ncbi:hypothetical protein [Streptomyces sp. NPDC047061]|uniref:hypothetical protein n=1 Tax=Streptomyces sp. NPDC047061 TaxID=3154605 RepID=UPI0033E846D2
MLLGCLAVAESLAEFATDDGSAPRMLADAASRPGRVQLALFIGLFCPATALPPLLLRPPAAGITVTAGVLRADTGSETLGPTLRAAAGSVRHLALIGPLGGRRPHSGRPAAPLP